MIYTTKKLKKLRNGQKTVPIAVQITHRKRAYRIRERDTDVYYGGRQFQNHLDRQRIETFTWNAYVHEKQTP